MSEIKAAFLGGLVGAIIVGILLIWPVSKENFCKGFATAIRVDYDFSRISQTCILRLDEAQNITVDLDAILTLEGK